jgi:hypothetical protein
MPLLLNQQQFIKVFDFKIVRTEGKIVMFKIGSDG